MRLYCLQREGKMRGRWGGGAVSRVFVWTKRGAGVQAIFTGRVVEEENPSGTMWNAES